MFHSSGHDLDRHSAAVAVTMESVLEPGCPRFIQSKKTLTLRTQRSPTVQALSWEKQSSVLTLSG